MFAQRLFPGRFFAPRYFPKIGAEVVPPPVVESYPGRHIATLVYEWDAELGRWVTYEVLGPELQARDEDWLFWLSL